MTNKDLAASFDLLAKLMELHQENVFKIRSYKSVATFLSKLGEPAESMTQEELLQLKGVGKAIADKIRQLVSTGEMTTLERYKEMTPGGIVSLLGIKGIGPGKVRTLWRELGVESVVELRYACEENRLIELKGFGAKTQADILAKLNFHLQSQGQLLNWRGQLVAAEIEEKIIGSLEVEHWSRTGELRRELPVIGSWAYVLKASVDSIRAGLDKAEVTNVWVQDDSLQFTYRDHFQVIFYISSPDEFEDLLERTTDSVDPIASTADQSSAKSIPPHMRELASGREGILDQILQPSDMQGVLHVHSNYSDGVDSIKDLAQYSRQAGYTYLGITDHSQIAVYANGLSPARLEEQWQEIDLLNSEESEFTILKGIECDILSDGTLDYDAELRDRFDFVIASVHTNLRMDRVKATKRILGAIADPATNIIGHPTGRLLLGREGYPLEMEEIFAACLEHRVALELNVSPSRLDIDWQWILPAQEQGVMIAVNPDAHAKEAIQYLDYGIRVAQKGWLLKSNCLNALPLDQFLAFCSTTF